MAELKTKLNDASIEDFLNTVDDKQKRTDSFEIIKIMQQVTKKEPKMWGPAIIGFGSYHYKLKVDGKVICRSSPSPPANRTSRSILG